MKFLYISLRATVAFSRTVFRATCLSLVALIMGLGILSAPAIAADNATDVIQSRAEAEFDRMTSAGAADQIKGQMQESAGAAKRTMSDAVDDKSGQLEGAADQAKGKLRQGAGNVKEAADKAGDRTENAVENFTDSVKDFFGQ
ncbi:CsbD family protein [Romeria aff. gracilis LEGE 07310]|uniref:CsbD family protein n=1 Tax=Vasconcelosia minhoensis LEGE 07310 TaxID=915328 RepID=A0A8J7ABD3_9CYAN|nr:CsbD family protein [Romeria gracilis]MBE9077366.1 CsbD family protein [Romeria aff. gracilis LEGE 07310]